MRIPFLLYSLIPTLQTLLFFSGDYTAGETPLPIPNREDKPRRADGTILATVWESRSLPGVRSPARIDFERDFYFL